MNQASTGLGRRALLAAGLAAGLAGRAAAQGARVTRIIVPVPAGGGMDACARLFAEYAPREALGQAIVENRPGGALRLAIEFVQRAEADGRTLLFAPASVFTIYPHIYRRLTYDLERDFAPSPPLRVRSGARRVGLAAGLDAGRVSRLGAARGREGSHLRRAGGRFGGAFRRGAAGAAGRRAAGTRALSRLRPGDAGSGWRARCRRRSTSRASSWRIARRGG